MVHSAFSFAHAGFGRFCRYWFIRKDSNPISTTPAHMANDCPAHGFYLPARNPTRLEGLQTKITLQQLGSTFGHATHSTTELLAVFHSLWHQHANFSNLQ
jgi:hypothetical protein